MFDGIAFNVECMWKIMFKGLIVLLYSNYRQPFSAINLLDCKLVIS